MNIKAAKIEIAIHFGGFISQIYKSNRLFNIERIHDGSAITLGEVVLIVCYVDKAV